MASFGSALRSTRLGRGISLDDVARDTRLTKRCLQAFEDESIHELPGEPYNRAYLRTYSAYLGLDPDVLVSDYEREAEVQTKAGRLAGRPDVLTAMREAVERRPLVVVKEKRIGAIPRTAGLVGVAVALLVGLVWVGVSRLLPNSEPGPVGTSMSSAQVSETGNKALEREAIIPAPSRPLDAGPTGIEVTPPPRLDRVPAPIEIPAPIKAPAAIKTPEPIKTPAPIKTPEPIKTPAAIKTPEPVKTPAAIKTPEPIKTPAPIKIPAPINGPAPRLSVPRSGVGTDVVDRELVGRSDTFAVGTRVIFWTFVTGGRPGETIRHVWTHKGRTAGAVDLRVASPNWRTQSRRTLVPGTEGEWVVEARDSEGRVLARHEFRCGVF